MDASDGLDAAAQAVCLKRRRVVEHEEAKQTAEEAKEDAKAKKRAALTSSPPESGVFFSEHGNMAVDRMDDDDWEAFLDLIEAEEDNDSKGSKGEEDTGGTGGPLRQVGSSSEPTDGGQMLDSSQSSQVTLVMGPNSSCNDTKEPSLSDLLADDTVV